MRFILTDIIVINPCFIKQSKTSLLFTQSSTCLIATSHANIVNNNNFVISLKYSYSSALFFDDYESYLKPTYDFLITDNNVLIIYFKVFYQKIRYEIYNDNKNY
jgi:hypothetical protein